MNILYTIAKLLDLKKTVTIFDIQYFTKLEADYILEVIHRNRECLSIDANLGITKWQWAFYKNKDGRFYYWGDNSHKSYLAVPNVHNIEVAKLFNIESYKDTYGYMHLKELIADTKENRQKLENNGFVKWYEADNNWQEDTVVDWTI